MKLRRVCRGEYRSLDGEWTILRDPLSREVWGVSNAWLIYKTSEETPFSHDGFIDADYSLRDARERLEQIVAKMKSPQESRARVII